MARRLHFTDFVLRSGPDVANHIMRVNEVETTFHLVDEFVAIGTWGDALEEFGVRELQHCACRPGFRIELFDA
jgi:hypothetical protein